LEVAVKAIEEMLRTVNEKIELGTPTSRPSSIKKKNSK
jgi:hypothetical protein